MKISIHKMTNNEKNYNGYRTSKFIQMKRISRTVLIEDIRIFIQKHITKLDFRILLFSFL